VRELLQREVFEPAGMTDTGWLAERSELVESAHVDQEFAGDMTELAGAPPPFEADALHATVLDLVRFQRALRGDELLNAASRARRLAPASLTDGRTTVCARGVDLTALGELPRHNAGGGMAGQRVHIAYYPTMDTTFALLARGPEAPVEALERSLARLVFDQQPVASRDLALAAQARALFLGEYYAGCTSYGITEAREHLVLVLPNGERHELLNQGDGRFLARDEPDLWLVFELDDGRAVAFELSQRGVAFRAKRVG
jgi:CubicO group peptidase (beta-lactamase class C family)